MERFVRRMAICFALIWLLPMASFAGVFDRPELQVTPTPTQGCSIELTGIEKVVDYDVSPAGPEVALLVKGKGADWNLVFWAIGAPETTLGWKAPAGFVPRAVAWHPQGTCIFVLGAQGPQYHIMRLEKGKKGWAARSIFESPNELRRLVVGPSPFGVGAGNKPGPGIAHRLFFGMKP